MPEFLQLLPPPAAREIFLQSLEAGVSPEQVETASALGRVTVRAVLAPQPLPAFPRATVDGFAVQAADTFGASESLPAYLRLAGEVPMGASPGFSLGRGQCALIHTGGMLPEGANAVIMVEHTQTVREDEIEALKPAAVGENVLKVGEDVAQGEEVIPSGTILRPAEIGGLMALGTTQVEVARRPRIGILSSGDEVVPPGTRPGPGQVRDVNAYTLSALAQQHGAEAMLYGIVPDQAERLYQAAGQALKECDLVAITAGSSASSRDLTAEVINRLGKPGVLVHGVNVKPGKPTILASCGGKGVVGLPGNPVSALVIASLFVVPAIQKLTGQRTTRPAASVPARLATNLPSQASREDWVAVRLVRQAGGEFTAEPIFSQSNLIFSLARADGLIQIPPAATGLGAGETVRVFLM